MDSKVVDELVSFLKDVKNNTADLNAELTYINGTGELIYATDIESNIIVFANKHMKELFGDIIGKKCYNALQGFSTTCQFCTNDKIMENVGVPYKWIFHNKHIDKLFFIVDICKDINGRLVRIEKAYEIDKEIVERIVTL